METNCVLSAHKDHSTSLVCIYFRLGSATLSLSFIFLSLVTTYKKKGLQRFLQCSSFFFNILSIKTIFFKTVTHKNKLHSKVYVAGLDHFVLCFIVSIGFMFGY